MSTITLGQTAPKRGRGRPPKSLVEQAVSLAQGGASVESIANATGFSTKAINKWVGQ